MSARRQNIAALIVTLLFHGAVLVVLMALYLRYTPADTTERQWPPVDSAEVLFGGEYVMTGDIAESEAVAEPALGEPEEAASPEEDIPSQAEPTPQPQPKPTPAPPAPVAKTPSPAKADNQDKAAAEKSAAEKAAAEKARREQETRNSIASRVNFGKTGSGGSGSGKAGQANGNSDTGKASGTPGYNLGGRTIASWETPSSAPKGTITVSVTVDRQGKVTAATYQSGTGAAAANIAARKSCVNAALKSRFSVDLNAPAAQKGTITYHFK
ncbi:MAG: hypothetical protein NC339_02445 [Muribaculaceae bacterium]|nr:hypothetical protein [Muribaculaceae bacterium]